MPRKLLPTLLIFALVASAQQRPTTKPPYRISCPPISTPLVKRVNPQYPKEALEKGISGSVKVEVAIDKTGKPSNMKVLKGDPILTEAVLAVLPEWRWLPVKLNGKAAELGTTVTVNFELRKAAPKKR